MEKNSAITLRKHKAGQVPEGNDALQLSDLYKLLQSVEKRLSERLSAIEESLTLAAGWNKFRACIQHNLRFDIWSQRVLRKSWQKCARIQGSLKLLFHGLPLESSEETPEQTGHVIRSFLTNSLRCSESDLANISFANVHRLPKHKSALQPSSSPSSQAPAIVVKFVKMKDKNMILKRAPWARQFKKNITRHLPRSMQEQRKALLNKASKLFTSGKRIRWKIEGADYCLYADGERVLPD